MPLITHVHKAAPPLTANESEAAVIVASMLQTLREEVSRAATAAKTNSRILLDIDWLVVEPFIGQLADVLARETAETANTTSRTLRKLERFTTTDPLAINWAANSSSTLITNISEQQRALVQQQITLAVQGKQDTDQTARQLRNIVGLNNRQATALANHYDRRYQTVFTNSVAAGMSPASAARQAAQQAASSADRYHDRLLNQRARTIARTEIMSAQNQGRWQGWQDGVKEGYINEQSVKTWVITIGTACDICAPWQGMTAYWDEPFDNGVMMPPYHPNCRCTATIGPPDGKKRKKRNVGYETQPDGSTRFTGTRCALCPGNCKLRIPATAFTKDTTGVPTSAASICPGLPQSAPSNAIPITSADELDVGDIMWNDHLKHQAYEVMGFGAKPGQVKLKAVDTGQQTTVTIKPGYNPAKPKAITPGPAKLAKVTFDTTPDAPMPTVAPTGALKVTKAAQVHPGDTLYIDGLAHPSYTVLGPGNKPDYVALLTPEGKKTQLKFKVNGKPKAIVPGPDKAKYVLGQMGDGAAPPHPKPTTTAAPSKPAPKPKPAAPTPTPAPPAPRVWQPTKGHLTGHADYPGNTYLIKEVNGDTTKVITSSGKEIAVPTDKLVGLPPGVQLKVTSPAGAIQVKTVKSVKGDIATFTDNTTASLTQLTKNGTSSQATKSVTFQPQTGGATPPTSTTPSWAFAKPPTPPKPPKPPTPPKPQNLAAADGTPFAPAMDDPTKILGTQFRGPAGSNTAPPSGFWRGTDGVERYVKAYGDPEQAYSEMLSNRLYEALGFRAPKTSMSVYTDPATGQQRFLVVTEIVDNRGTVGSVGLSEKAAREISDGTAADLWLANFDSVGMGLDNVVFTPQGIARIDSGGSLFFRAQGARKTSAMLDTVDIEALFTLNRDYKRVLNRAGFSNSEELLRGSLASQVRALRKIVTDAGGTERIVTQLWDDVVAQAKTLGLPHPAKPDLKAYAKLLDDRLAGLEAHAAKYAPKLDNVQPDDFWAPAPRSKELAKPQPPQSAGQPVKGGYTVEDAVEQADITRPVHVAWDKGFVENLDIEVTGYRDLGQDITEFRFKMTANNVKHLERQIAQGNADGWRIVNKAEIPSIDRATKEKMLGTNWQSSSSKTLVKQLDDGTQIEVIYSPSYNDGGYALHGYTRVIGKKSTSNTQSLQQAMSELLADANDNVYLTEDATWSLKANRLVSLFAQSQRRKTPDQIENLLDDIKARWGITPDDMILKINDYGRPEIFFPKTFAKKLAKESGVTTFLHQTSDVEGIAKMLIDGYARSTVNRWTNGINISGMSSTEDVRTGGASYFFTRQKKRALTKRNTILWKSDELLTRTDWFAYKSDLYGRRVDSDYNVRESDNFDNLKYGAENNRGDQETMFADNIGINETLVKKIMVGRYDQSRFESLIRQALADGTIDQARYDWIVKIVEYV